VIPRLAIALAVFGLAIAAWFLWRGPSVSTPSTALTWTKDPLDAGALDVEFSVSGVDFIRAQDANEPALSFAVLRRGDSHLALDDFNFFHLVEAHEGRLWAIGESSTEGPGPALDLLVSEDEGRTFVHRASVPKPYYLASFERWSVSGDEIALVLSLDERVPLGDLWLWPWWSILPPTHDPSWDRVRPTIGPGRFLLRSKNGGRSWRLER
jgi:hypothetical protein